MVWHDDTHLQVGDTNFLVSLDPDIWGTVESTPAEFVLLKNRWLVQTTLDRLPTRIDNMVEFGIFKGGSVALYDRLFAPRRLVGVDIQDDRVNALDHYLERRGAADRIHLSYGTDQADRHALEAIARESFPDRSLDLVVDDASHQYEPSKAALNVFLPLLRPGGVYLIEDWAWAHWRGDQEFQKTVGSDSIRYTSQKFPMTKLICEAAILAACRPDIISDVLIDSSRAFLTRGPQVMVDRDFDITKACHSSLWTMKFIPRRLPIDLWRRRVPLPVRQRVPPSFPAWVRRQLPR